MTLFRMATIFIIILCKSAIIVFDFRMAAETAHTGKPDKPQVTMVN